MLTNSLAHLDWSPEDQKLTNQSVNSVDWVHGVLVENDDSSGSVGGLYDLFLWRIWLCFIYVLRTWVTLNSKATEFRECFRSDLLLNENMESELWNLICLSGTNVSEGKECGSFKEQGHSCHIYFVGVIVYPLSLEDVCCLDNKCWVFFRGYNFFIWK